MAGSLPIAGGAAAGCTAHRGSPREATAKEQHMTPQGTGTGTVVGSLRAVDGKAVGRMEDAFDTDARGVWSAVTDPQRRARWVAQVCGDLRLGGAFRATFTSGWEGPG